MKKVNWPKTYLFVGGLDALQIGILFLLPVGEILDFILDFIIAIGITVWAWRKGLLDLVGAAILGFTFIIELCTDGGAPFWVLDIWALQKRSGGKLLSGFENEAGVLQSTGLNQNGRRNPTGKQQPLNQGGRRQPM